MFVLKESSVSFIQSYWAICGVQEYGFLTEDQREEDLETASHLLVWNLPLEDNISHLHHDITILSSDINSFNDSLSHECSNSKRRSVQLSPYRSRKNPYIRHTFTNHSDNPNFSYNNNISPSTAEMERLSRFFLSEDTEIPHAQVQRAPGHRRSLSQLGEGITATPSGGAMSLQPCTLSRTSGSPVLARSNTVTHMS